MGNVAVIHEAVGSASDSLDPLADRALEVARAQLDRDGGRIVVFGEGELAARIRARSTSAEEESTGREDDIIIEATGTASSVTSTLAKASPLTRIVIAARIDTDPSVDVYGALHRAGVELLLVRPPGYHAGS